MGVAGDTVTTDMVLAALLVTYAYMPSGLKTTSKGASPTKIVSITVLDASITETVSLRSLVT